MVKRLIGIQAINDINIEEQSEQNKRDKMLEKWLEIKGSKATFRALIEAFNDIDNIRAAEEVQKLASSIVYVIEGRRCHAGLKIVIIMYISSLILV